MSSISDRERNRIDEVSRYAEAQERAMLNSEEINLPEIRERWRHSTRDIAEGSPPGLDLGRTLSEVKLFLAKKKAPFRETIDVESFKLPENDADRLRFYETLLSEMPNSNYYSKLNQKLGEIKG